MHLSLLCSESSNACKGLEQGGQAGGSWWGQSGLAGGSIKEGRFLLELKEILPELAGKGKNRQGKTGNSDRLYFWGAPKSLPMVTAAMKLKDACSLKESYDKPRQHIKKQRHYFANKGPHG